MNDDQLHAARLAIRDAGRIVSFSGAGLSAESGLSTFREKQTGLWAKYDPMTLASPQGFEADAAMVIDWYNWRRGMLAEASPNPAHHALASQSDVVHITQNVDDLLERAGAHDVIHLHGVISRDRCHARCGVEEDIDLTAPPPLRTCPCGASMRPSVVWFGESLPAEAWTRAEAACRSCDVLLVIGTIAAVHPAAGLIEVARSTGATILVVNTESSGASHLADIELIGKCGDVLPRLFG